MKNQEADDLFLRDMQRQCLEVSKRHILIIRNSIVGVSENPESSVSQIMAECQGLKVELQAVGFTYCVQFLHDLESALGQVYAKIHSHVRFEPDREVFSELDRLLMTVTENLELYIEFLISHGADEPDQNQMRRQLIGEVLSWKPKLSDSNKDSSDHIVSEKGTKALYLLCSNDEKYFAIPAEQVIEVVQQGPLTLAPCHRLMLMGLMNLRGDVLPLLDMSHVFGKLKRADRNFVVVSKMAGSRFGFAVGHAEQILELDPERFQALTTLESSKSIISHSYVDISRIILIVDIRKALAA